MAEEAKHKHLEFIQATISRLGTNSFHVKSWTVTVVAAIFVLAADKGADVRLNIFYVSAIPVVIFWILDGYFLWQERLFRKHYDFVGKIKNDKDIDFQMDILNYNEGRNTWIRSIFSKTLNIFYLTLLFLMVTLALIISCS
jgi:hypothetical protein